MSTMVHTVGGRWVMAALGAGAGGVAFLLLLRGAKLPAVEPVQTTQRQVITLRNERDKAISDEAALLDPTPLFLPTKWNATQREVTARESVGPSQDYDRPKMVFTENELKLGLSVPIAVPKDPADAVTEDIRGATLVGFGRVDAGIPVPEARGAYLQVVVAGSGRKVLAQRLIVTPPGQGGWRPMEFLVDINAMGLVGPPAMPVRSGQEEVDAFFTNYLARTFRIGERLEPGFYRISIGP